MRPGAVASTSSSTTDAASRPPSRQFLREARQDAVDISVGADRSLGERVEPCLRVTVCGLQRRAVFAAGHVVGHAVLTSHSGVRAPSPAESSAPRPTAARGRPCGEAPGDRAAGVPAGTRLSQPRTSLTVRESTSTAMRSSAAQRLARRPSTVSSSALSRPGISSSRTISSGPRRRPDGSPGATARSSTASSPLVLSCSPANTSGD